MIDVADHAKLRAICNALDARINQDWYYRPEVFRQLFERFQEIQERLRVSVPALADTPLHPCEVVRRDDDEPEIEKPVLESLQVEVRYVLDVLAGIQPSPFTVSREGAFFAGQRFDAFAKIADILKGATVSIHIVDGYVGDGTELLSLCATKSSTVNVRIMTTKPWAAFKAAVAHFAGQYGGIEARLSTAFHDRFVIIDDKDFYHFGASLKDAGAKGFMFSRIEEPPVVNAIRAAWTKEWSTATVVV